MRQLTASTTEGREWAGDNNEATPATIGDVRARKKTRDVVFSVSSSGAIRPVRAAGRVDIEVEIRVALRKQGSSGSEHRLL